MIAALPIVGGYAEYMCLPSDELVPIPPGLDHAEAVSLVLNYITAYQMLYRCAHIKLGEIILINVVLPAVLAQHYSNWGSLLM